MRRCGSILTIVGLVVELLLILAVIGGAAAAAAPGLIFGGALVIFGRQLTRFGRGIRSASDTMATEDVPVTPEVVAVLRSALVRQRRGSALIIGVPLAVLLLLGAVGDLFSRRPGVHMLPLMAVVGFSCSAVVACALFFTAERPLRRDLRERSVLRTTGPVQVVPTPFGALLRLADRAFFLNQKSLARALRRTAWGTIEYSRHAHVIFDVQDRKGQIVYRAG